MVWEERIEPWVQQKDDARVPADVDYARVTHSASFRRLQGKTQILNLGDGDFYRTRLTHSLEVAQIAASITRQLRSANKDHSAVPYLPELNLIQAVGFTHDLGHPPFGHGGEVALNYCMRDQGGFEGNGQTLRILSKLEKFSQSAGANLSRRTLLGVLKYPTSFSAARNPKIKPALAEGPTTLALINRQLSKPPKCYLDCERDVVDWVLGPLTASDRDIFISFDASEKSHSKARHKSFDCSIMDLADDISFGVHDLEDAIALNLMSEADFRSEVPEETCAAYLNTLKERYPGESQNDVYEAFVRMIFGDGNARKHAISRMVNFLVISCRIETRDELGEPLIRYRAGIEAGARTFINALKSAVSKVVITSPSVQHLEFKGQRMVVATFEAFMTEPEAFLPRDTFERFKEGGRSARTICDHIAGMTDLFLLKTYERLFSPRMGSVFDKL